MNLKQLSHHLGLSQTTVSRALNGFPEVAEKTRVRVQKAADDLGYAPSQVARGLATGKVGAIGHIVPLGEHRMINPHFSDFMAGAGSAYAEYGTDIVLKICKPEDELATYESLVRSNRVDGFVLQGPMVDDPRIGLLTSLKVPFVVHGRSEMAGHSYNFLDVDNEGAFHRATQFLLDHGHRDIALINGLEQMNFAYQRRLGFLRAMAEAGVSERKELMFSEDMSEAYGYEMTANMLGMSAPPTAILSASKLIGVGAMRAVAEAGLTPGRDISVITFDDDFAFMGTHARVPQITCLRSSLYEAGQEVARMVVAAAAKPDVTTTTIWEPEFVVGRSTGPCPV